MKKFFAALAAAAALLVAGAPVASADTPIQSPGWATLDCHISVGGNQNPWNVMNLVAGLSGSTCSQTTTHNVSTVWVQEWDNPFTKYYINNSITCGRGSSSCLVGGSAFEPSGWYQYQGVWQGYADAGYYYQSPLPSGCYFNGSNRVVVCTSGVLNYYVGH